MKHIEDAEQAAFFKWLCYQHPKVYALTFHIPNGGRRDIREACRLQLQGVKRGVPDIMVAVPNKHYHGLFIELKRPKTPSSKIFITPQQKTWLANLQDNGYKAVVAYGFDEAKKIVEEYLKND